MSKITPEQLAQAELLARMYAAMAQGKTIEHRPFPDAPWAACDPEEPLPLGVPLRVCVVVPPLLLYIATWKTRRPDGSGVWSYSTATNDVELADLVARYGDRWDFRTDIFERNG